MKQEHSVIWQVKQTSWCSINIKDVVHMRDLSAVFLLNHLSCLSYSPIVSLCCHVFY